MIKEERQSILLSLIQRDNFIKISDLSGQLNVTEMTVRRDLKELEKEGKLIRLHGGAKSIEQPADFPSELSHIEKKEIHWQEKRNVSKKIAEQIEDGETVFLGPGTTIEHVHDYIEAQDVRIITNSIFVFNKFKNDPNFELVLIGGTYKDKTGSFTGTIANDFISTIYVQKAFIGVNAISDGWTYNINEEEGLTQKLALEHAEKKYIVSDHYKFDKKDFYPFFPLEDIDYIITDEEISSDILQKYGQQVKIIF